MYQEIHFVHVISIDMSPGKGFRIDERTAFLTKSHGVHKHIFL
jgi:hypothetical protein